MPGLGSQPMAPPLRLPATYQQGIGGGRPQGIGGGRPPEVQGSLSLPGGAGGILMGGTLPLPGSAAYAAKYADWMKGPEAQATFQSEANDQAKLANALNPYSAGYDAEAATAMKATAGNDPYDGSFRQASGKVFDRTRIPGIPGGTPGPMPPTPAATDLTTRPPTPGPTPMPQVGVNAWQAARTMRKPMRKPPIGGTGPMKPPQPYAIA